MKQINKSRGELRPSFFLLQHPRASWGPRGRRCWQVGRTRNKYWRSETTTKVRSTRMGPWIDNKCGPALLTLSSCGDYIIPAEWGGTCTGWLFYAVLSCRQKSSSLIKYWQSDKLVLAGIKLLGWSCHTMNAPSFTVDAMPSVLCYYCCCCSSEDCVYLSVGLMADMNKPPPSEPFWSFFSDLCVVVAVVYESCCFPFRPTPPPSLLSSGTLNRE